MSKIGDYIKIFRQKRGFTQRQLANLVGTSFSTLRRWEVYGLDPRIDEISKLCEVLHVTEAELLNGPESKEIKITIHYCEMPKESEINMDGNEFDLYMSGKGNLGIKGGAKFASLEDIDSFLARAREQLVEGFAFQQKRGALARA